MSTARTWLWLEDEPLNMVDSILRLKREYATNIRQFNGTARLIDCLLDWQQGKEDDEQGKAPAQQSK